MRGPRARADDGFTQAQEKRLRSRKKDRTGSAEDLTEEQKWRQMYQILFPDVRACGGDSESL